MARRRSALLRLSPREESRATMALLIGPVRGGAHEDPPDGVLELLWRRDRARLLTDSARVGRRPWGWWTFDAREPRPSGTDETVRLAELGELTVQELAALAERANEARLRVDTPAERVSGGNRETGVRVDVLEVELWERVRGALEAAS